MLYRTARNAARDALLGLGFRSRVGFPFLKRVHPYRPPSEPRLQLSQQHFAPTRLDVAHEQEEQPSGALFDAWRRLPGGHKWLHYFRTYQEAVAPFAGRPIRMLEIGVFRGASIAMWHAFLPPGSVVVGIDIDPTCARFERADANLFVRIGDQSDPAFLSRVVAEFGPFDFILDDGSHINSHMIASFNHLFLSGLKSPGVYLAEDTHANFWTDHRDQPYSFVDMAKDLVDFMHSHYPENPGEPFFRRGNPARVARIDVPRLTSEIDEIRFRDSLVTIYRKTRRSPPMTEMRDEGAVGASV